MPLGNNVGRISDKHTHKWSKYKPQANINFKQNKKKPEHILSYKQYWNRFNNIKYWFKWKLYKSTQMFSIISH